MHVFRGFCRSLVVGIAILSSGFVDRLTAEEVVSSSQRTDSTARISTADWDAVRQSAERYATAYNTRNAEAIAELYAENAELVDADGNVFQGRAAIEREYSAFFEANSQVTIRIVVDDLRTVAPGIIAEDGTTETTFGDNAATIASRYTAVHARQGDTWRLVSVRDSDSQVNDPGGRLEQLAWLIGQWVDEDADSLLEIDCYWHESGAYLIRDFKVRVEGLLAASGTERIGWDPLRRQVRSWLFDSEGGYLEGDWVHDGDTWTVTARGFRADGKPSKATYVVTPLKNDAYHMASFNRFAGESQLDDLDMTVVRKPPAPREVGTAVNGTAREQSRDTDSEGDR